MSAASADALARKQALLDKQAESRKNKQQADAEIDGDAGEPVMEEEIVPVVPMREDMISNAMKFLSHENVKRTPLVRRVAFLEQKGLTNEEITEALRRVGAGPATTTAPAPVYAPQPLTQPPPVPQRVQYVAPPPPPPRSTFKLVATSVILTLSAVGGATWLYNSFFRQQIKKNEEKSKVHKTPITRDLSITAGDDDELSVPKSPVQNNLQASMSELVQVMKTQQTEVKDTLKMVHTVLTTPTPDKNSIRSTTDQINVKELTSAITELHSLLKNNNMTPVATPITPKSLTSTPVTPKAYDTTPMRSSKSIEPNASKAVSLSSTMEPKTSSPTSAPKSFSEVMKMVQSGEPLPNVKQIDDSPINPSAVVVPSKTEKPLKPWEKRRQQRTSKIVQSPVVEKPAYLNNFRASNDSNVVPHDLAPELEDPEPKKSEELETENFLATEGTGDTADTDVAAVDPQVEEISSESVPTIPDSSENDSKDEEPSTDED